jgi:hypothetical protein
MVCEVSFRADAYYDQAAVCRLLRVTPKAIGTACRSGQLRFAERAGNRFFRGEWLNDWLSPEPNPETRNTTAADAQGVPRG